MRRRATNFPLRYCSVCNPWFKTLSALFQMSQRKNGPGGMAIDNINGMVPTMMGGQNMMMGGMQMNGQVILGAQQIPVRVTWSVNGTASTPAAN